MNEAERISKRTFCERCGTCCIKGGPALHEPDLRLIEAGILTYGMLYTLRAGELVREQVKGGLAPLAEEIVKIRGVGENRWTCMLYDDEGKACTIYEERPEECRTFNCWAPEDLAAMYETGRLTRAGIVAAGSALADLVAEHEARAPYAEIEPLAYAALDGDDGAASALADKVVWDAAFRSAFAEKTGADRELDFLFGRPLRQTLGQYGLEVVREGEAYAVRKAK